MCTGWRSRGYLPHCDERGLVQHIVFGLADAMPKSVPASIVDPAKRAEWADRALDANHGSRLLAKPEHAAEVQRCLLHDDGERYALVAWCVMPTHVQSWPNNSPAMSAFGMYALREQRRAKRKVVLAPVRNAIDRSAVLLWADAKVAFYGMCLALLERLRAWVLPQGMAPSTR